MSARLSRAQTTASGELTNVVAAFRPQPELLTWRLLFSLVLAATGAFAVNCSTSVCTHVTSPRTTRLVSLRVAGQVKNVLHVGPTARAAD